MAKSHLVFCVFVLLIFAQPASADDTSFIQGLYDAACASVPPWSSEVTPVAQIPAGAYSVSFPITVNCPHTVTLAGASQASTSIFGNGTFPIIFVEPPSYLSNLGTIIAPSLVAGPGNSLSWNSDQQYYLNLKDVLTNAYTTAAPLNGFTAITIEAFIDWQPANAPYSHFIVSSEGSLTGFPTGLGHGAVYMAVAGDDSGPGDLLGALTISGTQHSLVAPKAITPGNIYHVALSYDGSAIRLFVNGVMLAQTGASGSITQQPTEDMFLGGQTAGWPEVAVDNLWRGQIDSFRISDIARYTANFPEPTIKLSGDPDTVILLNFTQMQDAFVKVDYGPGNAWLAVRNQYLTFAAPAVIQDLTLNGGTISILAEMAPSSAFRRLNLVYPNYVGIKLVNNDYESKIEDVTITAGRYAESGFQAQHQAGDLTVSGLDIVGGGYVPFVLFSGSGVLIMPYVSPSDLTIASIVLKQEVETSDVTLIQPMIDTEAGGSSIPLVLVGPGPFTVIGGDLETPPGAPAVLIAPRGMQAVTLEATHVEIPRTRQPIIEFVGSDRPVTNVVWLSPVVNGRPFRSSGVPLSNVPRFVTLLNACPAGLRSYGNSCIPLPSTSFLSGNIGLRQQKAPTNAVK
jgi:hypothetical protein